MGTFANFNLNTGCFTSETAAQLEGLLDGTLSAFIPLPTYIAAAGNDQATATPVQSVGTYVTSGVPGGGIMLPPITDLGEVIYVQNNTGNTLYVYPPPGASIDNGAPDEACTIIPYGSGQFVTENVTLYNTSVDPVRGASGVLVEHQFGGLVVSLVVPPPTQETDVPTGGGFTLNIANGVGFELIVPVGGAVGSSGNTVNFPPTPTSLQQLMVMSKSALAGVTFAGATIINAPTSMVANQVYGFQWIGGQWVRLF